MHRSVFHDDICGGAAPADATPLKADALKVRQGALSGAERPALRILLSPQQLYAEYGTQRNLLALGALAAVYIFYRLLAWLLFR